MSRCIRTVATFIMIVFCNLFGTTQTINLVSDSSISTENWGLFSAISISPNNAIIAAVKEGSGSSSDNIQIINSSDLKLINTIKGFYEDSIKCITFSSDNKFILSGNGEIWDAFTGKLVFKNEYSSNSFAIAYSQDGKLIAFGDRYGDIKLVNASTGEQILRIEKASTRHLISGKYLSITFLLFSPDSNFILSCSLDSNEVKYWDCKTGKLDKTFIGHNDQVNSIAYNNNGNILASCSNDGTIILWDVSTGKSIFSINEKSAVNSIVFCLDDKVIAAGCIDSSINIIEITSKEIIATQSAGKSSYIDTLIYNSLTDEIISFQRSNYYHWANITKYSLSNIKEYFTIRKFEKSEINDEINIAADFYFKNKAFEKSLMLYRKSNNNSGIKLIAENYLKIKEFQKASDLLIETGISEVDSFNTIAEYALSLYSYDVAKEYL